VLDRNHGEAVIVRLVSNEGTMVGKQTLRALVACLFALMFTFALRTAKAAKLYLVLDSSSESSMHCQSTLEDFYACITNTSDFNSNYVDGYGSPHDVPITEQKFAGTYIIDTAGCGDTSAWEPLLQCIVDRAKIPVGPRDFVMIHKKVSFFAANCRECFVNVGGVRTPIRGGWVQSTKCSGFTFGGIHELFEGTTWGDSDDCCNGGSSACATFGASGCANEKPSCAALNPSAGELTVRCGSGSYQMQRLTKGARSDGYFYGEDCHPVVDAAPPGTAAAVCGLPYAARHAGKCIGGQVVTCPYSVQTQDCPNGCSEDGGSAHCIDFSASCVVTEPENVCAGQSATVSVRCRNDGHSAWDANLELVVSPDADSPIADASWITRRIAAKVSPAAVAPASEGTFSFVVDAASASPGVVLTQAFRLAEAGSITYANPTDISIAIPVVSCDAGDAGPDASAGDAGGLSPMVGGCGCRSSGSAASSRFGVSLLFLVGIFVRRLTRHPRREHASQLLLSFAVVGLFLGCGSASASASSDAQADTSIDVVDDEAAVGDAEVEISVDAPLAVDPCSKSVSDGDWCGALLGGDVSTLYTCTAKRTTTSQVCSMGCQIELPGEPYRCHVTPKGPGKGVWIWWMQGSGYGPHAPTPAKSAELAASVGAGYVIIKGAENALTVPTNLNADIVKEFRSRGLDVYAFDYVCDSANHSVNPAACDTSTMAEKVKAAVAMSLVPGVKGMILDVEDEFTIAATRSADATALCDGIRKGTPGKLLGYTAYHSSSMQANFPWAAFDHHCGDVYMPQMYWCAWGADPSSLYDATMVKIKALGLSAPIWTAGDYCLGEATRAPSSAELAAFAVKAGPRLNLWRMPNGENHTDIFDTMKLGN
jgi:MYXO-CTERM domain-containing protein